MRVLIWRFNGRGCEQVEGEFELRFFEAGEDPLHPDSDTGDALMDSFDGRRLKV